MRQQRRSDALRHALKNFPVDTWRIGIVHSSYYEEEMETMVGLARESLIGLGVSGENITLHAVPGSFEIPLIGAALAKTQSVDALIGLGIIVEGETHHARLIAENAVRGMMDVQTKYAVPFGCEVLYVDDLEDARARLEKGAEAAASVLHSLAHLRKLQS